MCLASFSKNAKRLGALIGREGGVLAVLAMVGLVVLVFLVVMAMLYKCQNLVATFFLPVQQAFGDAIKQGVFFEAAFFGGAVNGRLGQ